LPRYTSSCPEDTREIGKKLVRKNREGSIICLYGPLAAGKTTLVKGMADGLGIDEEIVSPSYVLMRDYEGGGLLFHLDLFRINSGQEFIEAGLEEYLLKEKGFTAIEWAGRIDGILPKERIDVSLELRGEEERYIEVFHTAQEGND
jgi:tRNA threonylcarbamoyladenosine biosynthesis protein TsaE